MKGLYSTIGRTTGRLRVQEEEEQEEGDHSYDPLSGAHERGDGPTETVVPHYRTPPEPLQTPLPTYALSNPARPPHCLLSPPPPSNEERAVARGSPCSRLGHYSKFRCTSFVEFLSLHKTRPAFSRVVGSRSLDAQLRPLSSPAAAGAPRHSAYPSGDDRASPPSWRRRRQMDAPPPQAELRLKRWRSSRCSTSASPRSPTPAALTWPLG